VLNKSQAFEPFYTPLKSNTRTWQPLATVSNIKGQLFKKIMLNHVNLSIHNYKREKGNLLGM